MPKKKIKFIEIARRHECCLLYLLDILGVPFPKGSYGDHFSLHWFTNFFPMFFFDSPNRSTSKGTLELKLKLTRELKLTHFSPIFNICIP